MFRPARHRLLHALPLLALLALGFARAAPLPALEVKLAPEDWQRLRAQLAFPRPGLTVREARALQVQGEARAVRQVEIASGYFEGSREYRRYFRAFCSDETGRWRCDPPEDVVEPAAGGAVVLRPPASAQDVVRVAHFLGHAPGRADGRELVSVGSAGADLHVSYRMGACHYHLRLRREGELFVHNPTERPVAICP